MKKKRSSFGWIVIAAGIVLAVLLVRHFHIKNFKVVDPGILYTSGQPRGMDYTRLLYKYHIGTIVNVRMPYEHREKNWHNEEIVWVRNNGVKYEELPIDRADYFPDLTAQTKFLEIMEDKKNLPVLIHDSSGHKRVAMPAAVWLIKGKGISVDETIKIIENIQESPVTKQESDFIRGLKK